MSIAIYIHIPFCRKRCPYCDFVSNAIDGNVPDSFVESLCNEINSFEGPHKASSIFFGGGTPSLLSLPSLERIISTLRIKFTFDFSPEITIEANPDDIKEKLVAQWYSVGINRVSLGVQSFDDHVLKYLGRRHNADKARCACDAIANRYENWSMDLIFGAHPVAAWEETLMEAISLQPKHISAYGLTYEQGTPFGNKAEEAIDDDTSLEMYRTAIECLVDADYDHYEISNFAKSNFQCRHNLVYWQNLEYVGFGPAAFSYIDGIRVRNIIDLNDYMACPELKSEKLKLSAREIRIETIIQHMRLKSGLDKQTYFERFGSCIRNDFQLQIEKLIRLGLLCEKDEVIIPTMKGFELNNEIGMALVD